jgi:hypothetical protein
MNQFQVIFHYSFLINWNMYSLDRMKNRITFENFREQQQVEDVSSDTNERLRKWN